MMSTLGRSLRYSVASHRPSSSLLENENILLAQQIEQLSGKYHEQELEIQLLSNRSDEFYRSAQQEAESEFRPSIVSIQKERDTNQDTLARLQNRLIALRGKLVDVELEKKLVDTESSEVLQTVHKQTNDINECSKIMHSMAEKLNISNPLPHIHAQDENNSEIHSRQEQSIAPLVKFAHKLEMTVSAMIEIQQQRLGEAKETKRSLDKQINEIEQTLNGAQSKEMELSGKVNSLSKLIETEQSETQNKLEQNQKTLLDLLDQQKCLASALDSAEEQLENSQTTIRSIEDSLTQIDQKLVEQSAHNAALQKDSKESATRLAKKKEELGMIKSIHKTIAPNVSPQSLPQSLVDQLYELDSLLAQIEETKKLRQQRRSVPLSTQSSSIPETLTRTLRSSLGPSSNWTDDSDLTLALLRQKLDALK
ncbi:hypothetical protein BLNAU_759 [Blattamonas nauphoetae]|uniref:Uncharacterized protein n=1 Tax=Blattamonas nauphoetae TaxID=2049346 RepID=A0ABQ9YKF1_9EUKA|nr:hypothetical protein BLNAU_759 [Blattamonas nauphoetae]